MDIYLTSIYSIIYEDLTLIYDAITITATQSPSNGYSRRRTSTRDIAQALGVLMYAEAKAQTAQEKEFLKRNGPIASVGSTPQLSKFDLLRPANGDNKKYDESQLNEWAQEEIWEFIYYALITFSLDHLSQFPFWRMKVLLCCDENFMKQFCNLDKSLKFSTKLKLWAREYSDNLVRLFGSNGVVGLMNGCFPYLTAAYIQNWSQMALRFTSLLKALMTEMPANSTSFQIAKSLSRASFFDSNVSLNQGNHKKSHRANSSSGEYTHKFDENGDRIASTLASDAVPIIETRVQRLFRKVVMHPFILSSVHMICTPFVSIQKSNWIVACWHILRKYGIRGFASGWRVNLMFSLFAWAPFWSFGVYDTLVYKCMLDQGKEGLWTIFDNILRCGKVSIQSTATSQSSSISSNISSSFRNYSSSGAHSLFKFGILTVGQILPGFISFVVCRGFVWLTLGISRRRREQRKIRREVLERYWGKNMAMMQQSRSSDIMLPEGEDFV